MPIIRDAAGERTSFGRRRRRRGLIGRDRHRALSVAPLSRPCTRSQCARTRVARLLGDPPVYGVRLSLDAWTPGVFSHVFVIALIRPSQKETSPPVNPRSGFNFFRSARPNHRKSKSYVYFEPSTRDLIGPRISTSALFFGGYLSKTVTSTALIMINPPSNS